MTKCLFADKIEVFLSQKRNAGAVYDSNVYILRHFGEFVGAKFPDATTVTKEIFESWLKTQDHVHNNTINRRVPVLRQMCRYLSFFYPQTYQIPMRISKPEIRYQVHLITRQELQAFFKGVDTFHSRCMVPKFSEVLDLVIPVVFRILYACGMRSGEVLKLKREDVNLETGKVLIRESKAHKLRVIFMHPQMLSLCRDYDGRMELLCPEREPFFCNEKGTFWHHGSILRWFHMIWDKLPEAQQQKGNPFTPHSFRHHYALTTLNRWYREGRDLNVMLPYLAEYMGHSNLNALDYYLHLNEEFDPEIGKAIKATNDFILPEVCDGY